MSQSVNLTKVNKYFNIKTELRTITYENKEIKTNPVNF